MPRNERFSLPIPRILHGRSLRLFSIRIADLFRNYLIKNFRISLFILEFYHPWKAGYAPLPNSEQDVHSIFIQFSNQCQLVKVWQKEESIFKRETNRQNGDFHEKKVSELFRKNCFVFFIV